MAEIVRDWQQLGAHLATLDARDVQCHESEKVLKRRLAFVTNADRYLQALHLTAVLDVGAAGLTRDWWRAHGYTWHGLSFPRDAARLQAQGIAVDVGDVASMPYAAQSYDVVYASHVLEHSPMPLVALLECRRVGRVLAMAAPQWPRLVDEPYHYSVVPLAVWGHWLEVAGWRIAANLSGARDYQFVCAQTPEDFAVLHAVHLQWVEERRARKRARARVRKARGPR